MAHRLRLEVVTMIHALPSSMQTLWHRHELLANNLANASTAGFKQDDVLVMAGHTPPEGLAAASSSMTPVGGYTMAHWTDHSTGVFRDTGRDLDLAIDGPGFLVVQTPRGLRYTRAGALSIGREGTLVTSSGHPVMGEGGPITVRSARPVITPAGDIRDGDRIAGRLQVVDFPRPYRLAKEGDGVFAPTDPAAEPVPAADYQVVGGTLEESNVDPVRTMVQMIAMLRHYESAQRVVQAVDEADRAAANDLGRV
jgi:flagellar basal-body rod protein FlgG